MKKQKDRRYFENYFLERFGVEPAVWSNYVIHTGRRSVYIYPKEAEPPEGWQFKARGFRIARLTTAAYKPGNRLLQWLNDSITKNLIELERGELKQLMNRRDIEPQAEHFCSRGYVALVYRKLVVGCGFWTGQKLRTQMSKGICRQFPDAAFSG